MRFNGDVVFVDTSGQVRSRDGDLTLRADDTGLRDIIVGSGQSLRPETPDISLGQDYLPWRHLYARGGSFTSRPSAQGSGVLLVGEIDDRVASYALTSISASFSAFTSLVWDQTIVEDSIYSRSGATITILKDGIYELDAVVNLGRPGTQGGGAAITVESQVLIDGTPYAAARGFCSFYAGSNSVPQAGQVSKHFAFPASSGTTISVRSQVLYGTGAVSHAIGSTLTLHRRGVSV